jgi:hypothetical protein
MKMQRLLLAIALTVLTATTVQAQAAGDWQRIHGQVQSIQGTQLTFKTDDGRTLTVDTSQVSAPVRQALTPNLAATVIGFRGDQPNRFTARYIQQDNAGPASRQAGTSSHVGSRAVSLVPQFLGSKEFQDVQAGLGNSEVFVTQLYQGFLDRAPTAQERDDWASYLRQTRDLQGAVEYFMKSPEYAQKQKNEQQAIRDLYEGVFGRQASADEIRVWEQRLASR